MFAAMDWAEEEIAAASRRHPRQADLLYHAFSVLVPRDIGPGMGTEFVYRGHVRELLDRIADGADLRPATAAEICLALSEISLQAPMHGAGAGLYFRMWLHAFPDNPLTAEQADHQVHYEHLHGAADRRAGGRLRHKAADPDRQLGDIDCAGRHHGQQVACRSPPADRAPAAPTATRPGTAGHMTDAAPVAASRTLTRRHTARPPSACRATDRV